MLPQKSILLLIGIVMSVYCYSQRYYCSAWERPMSGNGSQTIVTLRGDYMYSAGSFNEHGITVDDDIYQSKGPQNIFIIKRDRKGNVIWVKTLGGPLYENLTGIQIDDRDAVYVSGTFTGTFDIDGIVLTSNGETDIFIAKFTAGGKIEWAKSYGGAGSEGLVAFAVDDQKKITLFGSFSGTLQLAQYVLTGATGVNFMATLQTANGNVVYANNFYINNPPARYFGMDKHGNIYYAGVATEPVTIRNIVIQPTCRGFSLYHQTRLPFFWGARYDTSGALSWARDFLPCDSTNGLEYYREYLDFKLDEDGYIYLSFISGAWPSVYGPNPMDPYNNAIYVFSPNGDLSSGGYLTSYGFLGTNVIRRYFLGAGNKRVLLVNTTFNNQIEYLPDIYMQSNYANTLNGIVGYNSGLIDANRDELYMGRGQNLLKLTHMPEVNAGADRRICYPAYQTIKIGGQPTFACGNPPYKYHWTPATGLSSDTAADPVVQLDLIGSGQQYILEVMDAFGIQTADTVQIIKNTAPPKPVIIARNNVLSVASPGSNP